MIYDPLLGSIRTGNNGAGVSYDPILGKLRSGDVGIDVVYDELLGEVRADDLINPIEIFSAGEQGAWFDPSDLSTLFQDSAGTTPVTAVEQPVGKILDKSGRGNHASQPTSAARPVLSARVNLLTKTEDFGDEVWTAYVENMSRTADTITANGTSGYHYISQLCPFINGRRDTVSFETKASTARYLQVYPRGASDIMGATLDTQDGTYATFGSGVTVSSVLLSDGFYRFSVSFTVIGGSNGLEISIVSSENSVRRESSSVTGSIQVRKISLVPADQSSLPYQRVNTATDYDTVGFPKYLKFDGVDDFLVTNSIDFSATDEMTVWSGVRKLRDSAIGMLAELSVAMSINPGSFYMGAPASTTPTYTFASMGITYGVATTPTTYASPVTNILTGTSDISADSAKLRINGSQVAESTADQGTGNYGNYPLYIGMRGGTTLPFKGHLYGLVVRGKTTLDGVIAKMERWINSKTKAY